MKSSKKKLLILTDWFVPAVNAGGPVRSVSAIVNALKNDFEISVLTSDRDFGDTTPFSEVEGNIWISQDGFRVKYLSPNQMHSIILKELNNKYDKIYLNSLFSKHFTINVLRELKGRDKQKVVLAPRGMLAQNALGLKSVKKKVFLQIAKLIGLYNHVTWHASTALEEREILDVFPDAKVVSIENLAACSPNEFHPQIKAEGELRMVFVSRISPKKNLLFLLGLLEEIQDVNCSLDIYGPIEDKDYWEKCEEKISCLKGVSYMGIIRPSNLEVTMNKYHLFVLPTLNENFGHIILEALNSSLPLLLSDNTPWVGLKEKKIGYSLGLEDKVKWNRTIEELVNMNSEDYSYLRRNAWKYGQVKLNQQDLLKEYIQLFS